MRTTRLPTMGGCGQIAVGGGEFIMGHGQPSAHRIGSPTTWGQIAWKLKLTRQSHLTDLSPATPPMRSNRSLTTFSRTRFTEDSSSVRQISCGPTHKLTQEKTMSQFKSIQWICHERSLAKRTAHRDVAPKNNTTTPSLSRAG